LPTAPSETGWDDCFKYSQPNESMAGRLLFVRQTCRIALPEVRYIGVAMCIWGTRDTRCRYSGAHDRNRTDAVGLNLFKGHAIPPLINEAKRAEK
jgi:hypothetical protein